MLVWDNFVYDAQERIVRCAREDRLALDLFAFCSIHEGRVRAPWSSGGWTFATDGAIAVRVARVDTIQERSDAPQIDHLFAPPSMTWITLPFVALPAPGRALDLGCSIEFTWGIFAQKYVRLIYSLDGVAVSVGSNQYDAMHFCFAGGIGVVMPMRTPHPRNMKVDTSAAIAA